MAGPRPGRPRPAARDAIPLALLLAAALAVGPWVAPWAWTAILIAACWAGCKALVWRAAVRAGLRADPRRALAWLVLWPGMHPRAARARPPPPPPALAEVAVAAGKTIAGLAVLVVAVRHVHAHAGPTAAAWAGLVGMALAVPWGAFHLLALAWRAAGVPVEPIFRSPAFAPSLSAFWSRRWNLAVRDLAALLVHAPLRPRWGAPAATAAAFVASGIAHDLVLSLPARGGWGLPTAYFLFQAAGVHLERSPAGRRLGLDGGAAGWIFMALVTLAPVPLLFHAPFIERVFLPFLDALGVAA
jgi:alginate O-acetyltransferase complex protein AlgI